MKLILKCALAGVAASQLLNAAPYTGLGAHNPYYAPAPYVGLASPVRAAPIRAAPVHSPYASLARAAPIRAAPVHSPYASLIHTAPPRAAPAPDPSSFDVSQAEYDLKYVKPYYTAAIVGFAQDQNLGFGSDPNLATFLYADAYEYLAQKKLAARNEYTGNDPYEIQQLQYGVDSARSLANSLKYPVWAEYLYNPGDNNYGKLNDLANFEALQNRVWDKKAADHAYRNVVSNPASTQDEIEAAETDRYIASRYAIGQTLRYMGKDNSVAMIPWVEAARKNLEVARQNYHDAQTSGASAREVEIARLGAYSAEQTRNARFFDLVGDSKLSWLSWILGGRADQDAYELAFDDLTGGDYYWP